MVPAELSQKTGGSIMSTFFAALLGGAAGILVLIITKRVHGKPDEGLAFAVTALVSAKLASIFLVSVDSPHKKDKG